MNLSDIIGAKFGRLLVADLLPFEKGEPRSYTVRCDCGVVKTVRRDHLLTSNTISCGCHRLEIFKRSSHGDNRRGKRAPEYVAWVSMRSRCKYPYHNRFKHYGGRGIFVCERWDNSYENFLSDMGRKPSPKHSIDRIDVNGNYEPTNCRWATQLEQMNNRQQHPTK